MVWGEKEGEVESDDVGSDTAARFSSHAHPPPDKSAEELLCTLSKITGSSLLNVTICWFPLVFYNIKPDTSKGVGLFDIL